MDINDYTNTDLFFDLINVHIDGFSEFKGSDFSCPKCEKWLVDDELTKHRDDIRCDVCSKKTKQCLLCLRCDYVLCFKCAAKNADETNQVMVGTTHYNIRLSHSMLKHASSNQPTQRRYSEFAVLHESLT